MTPLYKRNTLVFFHLASVSITCVCVIITTHKIFNTFLSYSEEKTNLASVV